MIEYLMVEPLHIMLVEDQKFSADLFRLAVPNHTIAVAESGEKALEMYERNRPNITFLDINLPGISGIEVLEKIRALNPSAYVVMLSAMNNEMYVRKCKQLGAVGFLTKPYNKEYINYYIEKFSSHSGKFSFPSR